MAKVIQTTKIDTIDTEVGMWQQVGLQRISLPQESYVMSTYRRIGFGVYTNRDNRYIFLRSSVLRLEEMSRFFENGSRQLAEELIREILIHGQGEEVKELRYEFYLSGLRKEVSVHLGKYNKTP